MKDVKDVFRKVELTLWCIGIGQGRKRDYEKDYDSSEDGEGPGALKKKKKSDRVEEIKAGLWKKHGFSFTGVQYSEMVVADTNESKDTLPPIPMFGANWPRYRSNHFEEH